MTTTYSLTYSLGTLTVNQFALNTQTSLSLPGYDCQVYGQQIDQNQLSLLENFAGPAAPQRPIPGQLWYDNTQSLLKLNRTIGLTPEWKIVSVSGSNTQIQYNDEGGFGASSRFTYSSDTSELTLVGSANISDTVYSNNVVISNEIIADVITGNTINVANIDVSNIVVQSIDTDNVNTVNIVSSNITATNTVSNNVTAGNLISSNASIQNLATGNIVGNSMVLSGNLTVSGTATYINSNIVTIADLAVNLGNNATSISQVNGGGIELGPDGAPFVTFLYNSAANSMVSSVGLTAIGNITGGNLTTTGTATVGSIKTDNYYYANGNPVDFEQPAGANSQLQYNNAGNFGASPSLTFNAGISLLTNTGNISAGNLVTGGQVAAVGNISGANIAATGNISATYFLGNGSQLTGLPTMYSNADVAAYLSSNSAAVITTTGTITTTSSINAASGNLTALTVTGTANIGTTYTTSITSGSAATSGTITGKWTLTGASTLEATYADLAENYVADAPYEPGTVVEFGGTHEITIAEDETRRVAGVVSTNPAYIMNGACDGQHVVTVALQGRVPCKVRGKIRKGDLMISGGDGYARPTTDPKIGTIIGKSLENFDGIGTIEIAVGRL